MIRTDLGIATAYAEAVSKGYTGTRDEFGQMFVDFGKTAEKVSEDKKAVEQMKASVEETKNSVDTTAAEFGQNVADKTEEAKAAISEAKDAATGAITEAQTSATGAIASAKDSATAEITKKGTDTLATIPEDYTALSKDVSSIKEDLSNKITKFYASNQGEAHITDSDNGKIVDMMIYGKSSQDGTPTPDNPVEIKSVVNPTVKVSSEDGTKSQTVTLPYTLNAIPVKSDSNYTDKNGQQWMGDKIDIEKGIYVQNIQELLLDDEELKSLTSSWVSQFDTSVILIGRTHSENLRNYTIMSDIFKRTSQIYNNDVEGIDLVDNSIRIRIFTKTQSEALEKLKSHKAYAIRKDAVTQNLSTEKIESCKALAAYYPVTNISVNSDQLDGHTVFNYPISMANGWNYVKQQLNDNRDYIYDMDLQSAEAYVNSEYAVALTEFEV